MSAIVEFLQKCPPLLSASDLVSLGLYPSTSAVASARRRGKTPPYKKVSDAAYKFPIDGVVAHLVDRGFDLSELGEYDERKRGEAHS